jgi:hypothetical protein
MSGVTEKSLQAIEITQDRDGIALRRRGPARELQSGQKNTLKALK